MGILSQPQTISPVYNDLTFVVQDATNASADGFKFIAQLTPVGEDMVKLKTPVYLNSTDKGVFMVQRLLESYISYGFSLDLLTMTANDSVQEYAIDFGHEAGGVEASGEYSVSELWTWNAAMTKRDFASYASGEWVCATVSPAGVKFLTTQRSQRMRPDQTSWLYFLTQPQPLAFYIHYASYRSYDAAGNLLKTTTAFNDLGVGTIGDFYVQKVPAGHNLEDVDISQVVSGTLPVIDPVAAYYTVTLYDNSDTPRTEEYRFNVLDNCTRFDSINIHYLNPMGGFDSFMFDLSHKNTFSFARKQMKRNNYELSGNNYELNLDKHAVVSYDTTQQESIVLNSDWLTTAEAIAMKELIASPVVFMHVAGDDFYTPVNVNMAEWETKDNNNDQLFLCELSLTVADNERLQRG